MRHVPKRLGINGLQEWRGRRGACNQSINIGGSLGERSNLMSHTHRDTPPPLFYFLLLLSDFSLTSSLDPFLAASPASATVSAPPRRLAWPSWFPDQDRPGSSRPSPADISWIPEGDGARAHTHKRLECCWVGVEEEGDGWRMRGTNADRISY